MANSQIAAVCIERDVVLAMRNANDFEALCVALANPWNHAP